MCIPKNAININLLMSTVLKIAFFMNSIISLDSFLLFSDDAFLTNKVEWQVSVSVGDHFVQHGSDQVSIVFVCVVQFFQLLQIGLQSTIFIPQVTNLRRQLGIFLLKLLILRKKAVVLLVEVGWVVGYQSLRGLYDFFHPRQDFDGLDLHFVRVIGFIEFLVPLFQYRFFVFEQFIERVNELFLETGFFENWRGADLIPLIFTRTRLHWLLSRCFSFGRPHTPLVPGFTGRVIGCGGWRDKECYCPGYLCHIDIFAGRWSSGRCQSPLRW